MKNNFVLKCVYSIPSGTSVELTNLLMGLLRRNACERMEFDVFFNHSFLQPPQPPSPQRSTQLSSSPAAFMDNDPGLNKPQHSTHITKSWVVWSKGGNMLSNILPVTIILNKYTHWQETYK